MLSLPSYDTPSIFDEPLSGTLWPDYGTAPVGGMWDLPAHGPPDFGTSRQAWTVSPWGGTLSNNPWSPTDQPLPSPLSEVGSYDFSPSPLPELEDGPSFARTSPETAARPSGQPLTPYSPAPTTGISTPVLQPTNTGKKRATTRSPRPLSSSSTKRPPSPSATPNPSRPRTLKRHRTAPPPLTATSPPSRTSSSSITGYNNTTLGGVLPANVDPRVAGEQIRREAWDRCRAEAWEMAQRRRQLLDHEQGALERETERLQASLGRMRMRTEAAAEARGRGGRPDGRW